MSTDVIVHGACGRMGREITRIVLSDPETRLVGCIDAEGHPGVGSDAGVGCGAGECGITISSSFESCGAPPRAVVIDFALPDATMALVRVLKNTPLVIGTTGFSDDQVATIRDASARMPVLLSPNMSLGVNLLFHLTEIAAARLGDAFHIEIVEAHHGRKKDAPSGTARRLGEIAASARGLSYDEAVRHGRSGIVGERPDREIGMHAVRGGDIVGDHTVLMAGPGERLELRHMAHTRLTFARGAVPAAKWIAGRPAGLYSMRDVLGF